MNREQYANKVALACDKLQSLSKTTESNQEKISTISSQYGVSSKFVEKILNLGEAKYILQNK